MSIISASYEKLHKSHIFNDEFIRDLLSIDRNELHDFDECDVWKKSSHNGKHIFLAILAATKSQE